jgi:hypothetical protein
VGYDGEDLIPDLVGQQQYDKQQLNVVLKKQENSCRVQNARGHDSGEVL